MKPVISVEHLSKQYDLGVISSGTLSRDLTRWWARVRGKQDPYSRIGQRDAFEAIGESILALDDVSFKVNQGEALGIIGRNGAGKSTLLKILSRVTAPSSGLVKVKGRIGSLLEVGTGFHPELTGRENVYLNGSILGMRKDEVTKKFDEIVDFSGVEKFIDTPVKRYSSGMYVRLAFAVAAHLDPEILIVDEVLAVGDAAFQKKCLGKMGDVAGEGRTVLFVSHNMAAIEQLCSRGLILHQGKLLNQSENIPALIKEYLQASSDENTKSIWQANENTPKSTVFKPEKMSLVNQLGEDQHLAIRNDEQVFLQILADIQESDNSLLLTYRLYDDLHRLLFLSSSIDSREESWPKFSKGKNKILVPIPSQLLNEGKYTIELHAQLRTSAFSKTVLIGEDEVKILFSISGGLSESPIWTSKRSGILAPVLQWNNEVEREDYAAKE